MPRNAMAPRRPGQSSGSGEMRAKASGWRREAMLHLRVFGAAPVIERVAESVAPLPGAAHVTRTDAGHGAGHALVSADVDPGAADAALQALTRQSAAR